MRGKKTLKIDGLCVCGKTDCMIPFGYCHCGCGQTVNMAATADKRKGWTRGNPIQYRKSHHAKNKPRTEEVKRKISFVKTGVLMTPEQRMQRHVELANRWGREHVESARAKDKRYRQRHPERRRENKRKWLENPSHRLSENIRGRIVGVLRGFYKSARTMELVGCSVGQLKAHLESQFTPGMSWSNYGYHGWHVDHIRPCASFDLRDESQQRECFHFTNLQPLWQRDNQIKGCRMDFEAMKSTFDFPIQMLDGPLE